MKTSSLTAVLALTLAACAASPGGEEGVSEASSAIEIGNGISLNGRSLNGRSLNGRSLNGRSLNGIALGGLSLDAGVLRGPGKKVEHTQLTGTLDDASTVTVRIDSVQRSDDDHALYFYGVSLAADGGWFPLCTDEQGLPALALALAGRWSYAEGVPGGGDFLDDPAAFTFACRGHALAKCVELGYAPFETVKVKHEGKLSLADHHQACTRAIRADYCGDGAPHTVDGTLIDLYDGVGIQSDTTSWPVEAEWGPDGARCVARERLVGAAAPACWAGLLLPGCGARSHFASGTLIITEDTP
jgi:hypothetical protein